ncbi:hypothetical protein [Bradyrhizobium sp. LA2.1]|uniref:hypothetical protein n=1 Tax=Bradyrhizobium sp. LA2.1 TaxID=3156376 RepID=UPI00339861BF
MSDNQANAPGQGWLDIIRRPSLEAFASAFAEDVALVTSVASGPIVGPVGVRHFFDATRAMYDPIAFVHETSAGSRTCLEWKGKFQGQDVAGITILCRNPQGRIEGIQLYHSPYEQVLAFSAELARRLEGKLIPLPFPGH